MSMNEPVEDREHPAEPPPAPRPFYRRFRTPVKMMALGVLTLLLLIPLGMVEGVLRERLQRRDAAVQELSAAWGSRQEVIGPVLVVPYRYRNIVRRETVINGKSTFTDEMQTTTAQAYFLPSLFHVEGTLDPRTLRRGIYQAVVYNGALRVSGTFDVPSLEEWSVSPGDILWDESYVAIGISDLRGAQDSLTLNWGDRKVSLVPATGVSELTSGVRAPLKGVPPMTEPVLFQMDLALSGSSGIRFTPVGHRNEVKLKSAWPDPSFQGAILPAERNVSAEGFEAVWKSSYYGRTYPQQWTSGSPNRVTKKDLLASSFGVELLSVVDQYRLVERTIKYGVLFIVLVFTAFFLFEMLMKIRIHTFQYTLVGVALCLFYLALLSLSEFLVFGWAYVLGAAACSALITLYCAKVLRSGRRALVVAAELSIIYSILFVILRLQDYSLLLGTAGLFVALGIVMYVTRNVDWYARDEE